MQSTNKSDCEVSKLGKIKLRRFYEICKPMIFLFVCSIFEISFWLISYNLDLWAVKHTHLIMVKKVS